MTCTFQAPAEAAERFGTVWRLRGEVTATAGTAQPVRTLRHGDPVFVGDTVRAESTAEAVFQTQDAGVVALRPGAVFSVEHFSAQKLPTDRFSVRIIRGALRIISGWIGHSNRAGHQIITPAATIGIRGTDHETYVMSSDLAVTLQQPQGTYDKVNRGGTLIDASGAKLEVDPGQVGFARATPSFRLRGLLTLLLPVLLDTVPDFYVPGEFDDELDRISPQVDLAAAKAMGIAVDNSTSARDDQAQAPPEQLPGGITEDSASQAMTAGIDSAVAPAIQPPSVVACSAMDVARTWLGAFDGAIVGRDAAAIVELLAPDVTLRATVRGTGGAMSTVEMGRDDFARSAVAALRGLTDYQQRRPSIDADIVQGNALACKQVAVRSVIIEQGRQAGLPYRFEALEEYVLEFREGRWYAISATTTQR